MLSIDRGSNLVKQPPKLAEGYESSKAMPLDVWSLPKLHYGQISCLVLGTSIKNAFIWPQYF